VSEPSIASSFEAGGVLGTVFEVLAATETEDRQMQAAGAVLEAMNAQDISEADMSAQASITEISNAQDALVVQWFVLALERVFAYETSASAYQAQAIQIENLSAKDFADAQMASFLEVLETANAGEASTGLISAKVVTIELAPITDFSLGQMTASLVVIESAAAFDIAQLSAQLDVEVIELATGDALQEASTIQSVFEISEASEVVDALNAYLPTVLEYLNAQDTSFLPAALIDGRYIAYASIEKYRGYANEQDYVATADPTNTYIAKA
jgi:hypothetical protein